MPTTSITEILTFLLCAVPVVGILKLFLNEIRTQPRVTMRKVTSPRLGGRNAAQALLVGSLAVGALLYDEDADGDVHASYGISNGGE